MRGRGRERRRFTRPSHQPDDDNQQNVSNQTEGRRQRQGTRTFLTSPPRRSLRLLHHHRPSNSNGFSPGETCQGGEGYPLDNASRGVHGAQSRHHCRLKEPRARLSPIAPFPTPLIATPELHHSNSLCQLAALPLQRPTTGQPALGTITPSSRSPRHWPPTAADATRAGLAQSSVPPCRPCLATHAGLPQSSSPLMSASRCHYRHPLHLSPSVPSHVGYLTLAKSVVETSDLATGTLHQATAALDQQPHGGIGHPELLQLAKLHITSHV